MDRLAGADAVSAAPAWNLSCPDWAERIAAGRSLIPDLPLLYEQRARTAVAVFNKLRLHDVPGTPTMGEAGGDWFREIVRALFGSLSPATGQRAIRELMLLVPKKNSKTTNGALLMLTALLLNKRPNASMIMTAPVHEVAQLAYDAAAGAIELDEVLKKKLRVRDHLKMIVHRETNTVLQIMTFDPSTLTGQKPIATLIDELHVVARMARAASAIRQLRGGMLPYPEAFMAFITTQSEEAPAGVFRAELHKARAIRDGKQAGAMLPVLYEFPPEVQKSNEWRQPARWGQVTPNAGRSVSLGRLAEEYATALTGDEGELRAWASQHLNVEVGLGLLHGAWAGAHYWEAQADATLTLDELLDRSEVVCIGIDGGGLDDLLGFAVIGRDAKTRDWLHWGHAWAHPQVLELRKSEAQRLQDFAADGDLTLVERIGEDVQEVADMVLRVADSGLLEAIGVDPAGIGAIVDAIVERGVEQERIIAITQGWKMTGAIKTTERKLAEGTLHHGGSSLMAWSVGNARVEPKGNAIVITKQVAGTAKIDPLMAAFNAVALMSLNPASRTYSGELIVL